MSLIFLARALAEEVFAAEVECGVGGVAHVAAEQGDGGAGGVDGDGEGKGAAVFESYAGGELISGFESGGLGGVGECEVKGLEPGP